MIDSIVDCFAKAPIQLQPLKMRRHRSIMFHRNMTRHILISIFVIIGECGVKRCEERFIRSVQLLCAVSITAAVEAMNIPNQGV